MNMNNKTRILFERPDLQEDPRFADDPGRMANLDDLVKILAEIFAGRSSGEWLRRLERAGVPAGPVLDIVPGPDKRT